MESPVQTEVSKTERIGSSNFIDYLIGKTETSDGKILRGDHDDFEKQIEVPEEIHQAIKEMYEQRREGLLTGPSYRAQKARMAEEMEKYLPGLGDALNGVEAKSGFVEQARVVFSDLDSGKLGVTSSTHGYGYEADPSPAIEEATKQNGLPLMFIHTHPEDVLFSPEDYALMMIKVGTENLSARLMNAGIVLLPEMQLMAVATTDTPMVSGEEVNKLLSERHDRIESGQSDVLKRSLDMLGKIYERRKVVEGVAAIKKAVGEKYASLIDEQAKQFNIQEGEAEQLERMSGDTERKSKNEGAQFINSELVSFAKEIGVKLYFSQDMRTFKEFSA